MAPIKLGGGLSLVDNMKKGATAGGTPTSGSTTGKKTPGVLKSKSGSETGKGDSTLKTPLKELVVIKMTITKPASGEATLAASKVAPPRKPLASEKGKSVAKDTQKGGWAEKTDVTPPSKQARKLEFEYSGNKGGVSEDSRVCANLFRSLGGSSRHLPPPQDMVEDGGYRKGHSL